MSIAHWLVSFVVLAMISGAVGGIIIVVDAFRCDIREGLLCSLVPFYLFYYMFAKRRHPRRALLIAVTAMGPLSLGILAVFGGIYVVKQFKLEEERMEARVALAQITQGVVATYIASENDPNPGGANLPPSAPPVPAYLSQVRGMMYRSSPVDWSGTWNRIQFSMREPQNFQYQWERKTSTQGIVRAIADLDGDGQVDVQFEVPISCSSSGSGSGCQIDSTATKKKGLKSIRAHLLQ